MKVKAESKEEILNLLSSQDETKKLAGLEHIQTQISDSYGKYLPDISLFNAIVNLGKNDKSVRVRTEVASLMGFLVLSKDKRVVKPLIDLAQDPHREVRAEAVTSMDFYTDSRFVDALLKALKDRTRIVRRRAIGSIFATTGTADEEIDFCVDQRIVNEMLKMLNSEDGHFREMALSILRHSKDKRILPPVVNFLNRNKNFSDRLAAICVLGSVKDRLALETLIELLTKEKSYRGKIIAIRELGGLGLKEAIKPLKKIADDEELDQDLRDAASVSIIKLGDDTIISQLENEFSTSGFKFKAGKEVRERIVNIAASAGTRECQNILRKGLSHGDMFVASNAAHALAKLGDRRALPLLLMHLNPVNPEDPMERADAVVSLGILGDRRAVKHLIEIYDSCESLVIEALGKLGGKEAVDFLKKMAQTEKRVVYQDQIKALLENIGR